jgi:hypothetical protein
VQTRTRNALVFAASAAAAAAGLAVVARHRRAPDLGAHALDAVPSGALVVAVADLGALRASPVGARFLQEGREVRGLGKVRDVCGFDPMDTLTEAALAIPAAGDAGEFGLVVAGPIDDNALVACASKIIEGRGGRPTVTTIGGFRSVHDASLSTTGGEIAVRPGGPLLLGAGTYLRSMIDAAEGRTPSIRSSRAHGFLGHEVGDASLRVTVVLSPELRKTLVDELQTDGAAGSPAGSIMAGALGVQLGPTVALHGIISCDDAAACAKIAARIEAARADRDGPLGDALEKLAVQADGELVHVRLTLSEAQASSLEDRLLGFAARSLRRPAREALPPNHPAVPPSPDEVVKPAPKPSASAPAAPAPPHDDPLDRRR